MVGIRLSEIITYESVISKITSALSCFVFIASLNDAGLPSTPLLSRKSVSSRTIFLWSIKWVGLVEAADLTCWAFRASCTCCNVMTVCCCFSPYMSCKSAMQHFTGQWSSTHACNWSKIIWEPSKCASIWVWIGEISH